MNYETLKYLIINHKERFLSKSGLVQREVLKESAKYINSREIIFITGIRRSGKSSLMRLMCDQIINDVHVAPQNILFINFEDERFTDFSVADFDLLFKAYKETEDPQGKVYLFLDEIQHIKGWERWINRLYEFEEAKIFITGSNASLLQSEISTVLTGRNRQLHNYPFSFREYLFYHDVTEPGNLYHERIQLDLKRWCKKFLESGGFPEVVKSEDVTLLDQYFKDIIYRDIIARHAIRNIREIKELVLFLISNIGTIISYDGLKKVISANNTTTIKNYIHILEDSYLITRISMFNYSVKKQIYNPDKYFLSDNGFYTALAYRFSENRGHRMENLVCIELLRRHKEIFYWKSGKGYEVDFIVREGIKPHTAIQVCFEINEKNREREVRGLLNSSEELGTKELLIINENEDIRLDIDNRIINVVPLWKWLVSPGK